MLDQFCCGVYPLTGYPNVRLAGPASLHPYRVDTAISVTGDFAKDHKLLLVVLNHRFNAGAAKRPRHPQYVDGFKNAGFAATVGPGNHINDAEAAKPCLGDIPDIISSAGGDCCAITGAQERVVRLQTHGHDDIQGVTTVRLFQQCTAIGV